MTKTLALALAAVLALAGCSLVPASAQDRVPTAATAEGKSFSIAISGLHDSYYANEPVTMTISIRVEDDGTTGRMPVSLTLWADTPLGRASLDDHVRRLAPGQTVTYTQTFERRSTADDLTSDGGPKYVRIGLTGTLKGETLDASKVVAIFPAAG